MLSPLGGDAGPGWQAELFLLIWKKMIGQKRSIFYPEPVLPPRTDGSSLDSEKYDYKKVLLCFTLAAEIKLDEIGRTQSN